MRQAHVGISSYRDVNITATISRLYKHTCVYFQADGEQIKCGEHTLEYTKNTKGWTVSG